MRGTGKALFCGGLMIFASLLDRTKIKKPPQAIWFDGVF